MSKNPPALYPAHNKFTQMFARFSNWTSHASGMPATFASAVALILVWGISGPLFGFSDTWQLVINTSTTIITFLMVFLIQHTQNRDSLAVQIKLDELVRALQTASNKFVGIENLSEEELEEIRLKCIAQAKKGSVSDGRHAHPAK